MKTKSFCSPASLPSTRSFRWKPGNIRQNLGLANPPRQYPIPGDTRLQGVSYRTAHFPAGLACTFERRFSGNRCDATGALRILQESAIIRQPLTPVNHTFCGIPNIGALLISWLYSSAGVTVINDTPVDSTLSKRVWSRSARSRSLQFDFTLWPRAANRSKCCLGSRCRSYALGMAGLLFTPSGGVIFVLGGAQMAPEPLLIAKQLTHLAK